MAKICEKSAIDEKIQRQKQQKVKELQVTVQVAQNVQTFSSN